MSVGAPRTTQVVVTPATVTEGGTIQIVGSGFTPGSKIFLMANVGEPTAVGITGDVKPPEPVINEFGAFSSSWKLSNVKPGVCAINVYGGKDRSELLATAPFMVTAKAK